MMARAAGGAVLDDAGVQLALGDVLQVLVDRQLDASTPVVGGRSTRLNAWRRASVWTRIVPGLAADLRVVGRLEAAQAVVVDADVAEQVRGQLLVRDRSAGSP